MFGREICAGFTAGRRRAGSRSTAGYCRARTAKPPRSRACRVRGRHVATSSPRGLLTAMADARPSQSSSRRGGQGGTGGTSTVGRPAASPGCPPHSAKRGTTATNEVGSVGLPPVVPLPRTWRGTVETQRRRGVPPVPPCPPAANGKSAKVQPPRRVPPVLEQRACVRDGRLVEVHGPVAGGASMKSVRARWGNR
jgi:hypothetical protein